MGAVAEAKVIITGADHTGAAFDSVARKVEGLGKVTKSVGEAASSIGKVAVEVDRIAPAVARSTEAVSRFSGALRTIDTVAGSMGQVVSSVERASATMPRLTADATNMARAMQGVAEAERMVSTETDRIGKAGSKLALFKNLQGDFKAARATFVEARTELDGLAKRMEDNERRVNALRQRRDIALAAEARAKATYDANPIPNRADAADKARFDAMKAARADAAGVMQAARKERQKVESDLHSVEGGTDTRKLARDYADAQKATGLAAGALDGQKRILVDTKREFEALAGPLGSITGAERRLVAEAEAATHAFEAQGRAATEAADIAARAMAREEAAFARAAQGRARWQREFTALEAHASGQRGALAAGRRASAVEVLHGALRRPAGEPPHSAVAREAAALAEAQMRLAAFREVQSTAAELRRAARVAQAEAARVGRDVRDSRAPSPELLAAHGQAQSQASAATRAFEAQSGVLKGLKAEIEGVLGPMHSLASAEAQLAERAGRADAAMKRQQSVHRKLHAAREIADDVLPFEGPEILHLTKEAYNEGAALQHERVGLQNAGRTPEQIEEIEHRSREVSARLPTATSEENLKIVAETTPAFGSLEHALEHLEFMQKTMSVLKSAGGEHIHGSAGDVGRDFAKFFEERLTKPEEFESEAKQMIPAMVASGGTFNPREMYMFAQQAKSALPNYDMHFLSRVAPSLITAMGGERAGTAANAFNSIIMGKVNDKKQAEAWIKAGLLDPSKVIMSKGHAVGWSAGAVKNTDLALRDPLAWAEQVQNPAIAATGVDMEDRLAVAKALGTMYRNQNGNMFATEMTQSASRSRLHKDEGLYDQVGDADAIYKRNLHEDPTVALGAIGNAIKTFAGDVTSPVMKDVANVLGNVSEGIASLGKGVADFDAAHPDLAKAIGGAALGGGLAVGGYLTTKLFTNLGSLFSGGAGATALTGSAGALTGSAEALVGAAAALRGGAVANAVEGAPGAAGNAVTKEAEKDAPGMARKFLPGLATLGVFGAVFGGIAGIMLGRDQKRSLVDGGRPDVEPQDNNLGLPGVDTVQPEAAAPHLRRGWWNRIRAGFAFAPAPGGGVPLPPVRPTDLAPSAPPAVLPVPVASLSRAALPPASASAPIPVHVVSTAANIPMAPMGPGMHRDFTLGNGTGGFSSPGLGAGGGFQPFPGHHAPAFDTAQVQSVKPDFDFGGLDAALGKTRETADALKALGAIAVSPQISSATVDALIAKLMQAKSLMASMGSAGGTGTTGSTGPSRVIADPGVGKSR